MASYKLNKFYHKLHPQPSILFSDPHSLGVEIFALNSLTMVIPIIISPIIITIISIIINSIIIIIISP